MDTHRRPSLRRALATLLTTALVAAGAVVGIAVPAQAAGTPALSATTVATPGVGVSVTVTGTGFEEVTALPGQAHPATYIAFVEKGNLDISQEGTPNGSADIDGAGGFTGALTVPVAALDRSKTYEVIAWPTRSNPSESNLRARADVSIDWTALFPAQATTTTLTVSPSGSSAAGADITLSATISPATAGTVSFASGGTALGSPVTVTGDAAQYVVASPTAGSYTFTASFTPTDADAYTSSTSAAAAHTVTAVVEPEPEPAPVPTVTVSKTSGLDAEGETVTVTGTGFLPNAPATSGTRPPLAGKFTGAYVVFGSFADAWQPSTGAVAATRKTFDTKWAVSAADMATIGGPSAGAIELSADGTFTTTLTVSEAEGALADGNWGVYTYPGGGAKYAPFETYTPISFAEPTPEPTLSVTQTEGLDPEGATITVTGENYSTEGKALYGPTAGQPAGVYAQIGWLSESWRPSEGAASSARTNAYSVWVQGANDAAPYLKWTDNGDGTADFTWTVTIDQATLDAKALAGATLSVFTVGAGGVVQAVNEKSVALTFAEPTEPTDPEPTDPETVTPQVTVTPASALDPNVENVITVTGTGFTGAGAASGVYVLFGETSVWSGGTALPADGWVASDYVPALLNGTFTKTLTIPVGSLDPSKSYQVATSAAHALSVTDRSLDTFTPVTVAQVALKPSITVSGDLIAGGTVTVTGVGFTAGDPAVATIHSDPYVLGEATVGADGRFTISGTLPADFPAGAHTVIVTVNGVEVAASSVQIAAAAPAVEAAPVATCTAQAVAGASITWGVKESFVSYINGPIASGSASIGWGSGSGSFNTDETRGRVNYGGGATFTGHSGLLDLKISNPTIQVTGSTATLSAYVQSKAYASSPAVDGRVVLATLSLPTPSTSGGVISWSNASATLTADGAAAFGGFYTAGTAMDPVSFRFPLGAEVACDATTSGELATTGGTTPNGTIWLGLGLLVLGAGLVALRRRRSEVHAG